MSRNEAQRPDVPLPPLDKEVVRLPDGRELTYYRFPEEPARAVAPSQPSPHPTPTKER